MDGLTESGTEMAGAELAGAGPASAFFDRSFSRHRVMAIIRGLPPDQTVDLCERAWSAGIQLVEVPFQDVGAVASLRAAAAAANRHGRKIGVGTVTTPGQVEEACRLGAAFTVAPGLGLEVARLSLEAALPHLPGVATATEVQKAMACGLRWMKVFPAAQLTAAWVKALLAPFPSACFVAVGGVDVHNAPDFLDAGARAVAVGSALNDARQIELLAALQERYSQGGTT